MKKLVYLIIIIGVSLGIYLNYYQGIKIGKIKSIKIENIKMSRFDLKITLPVENKFFIPITISGVDMDFAINGANAGTIKLNENIELQANTKKDIVFPVSIGMEDVLNNFMSIIKSISMDKAEIKLSGVIKVKTFFMTKNFPIENLDNVELKK